MKLKHHISFSNLNSPMDPEKPYLEPCIHDYDPQALITLLKSHLPHSVPLLRRLQHGLAYPSSTSRILTTFSGADAPVSPWLAAHVDLFTGGETQIVIYSSLEAQTTSPFTERDGVSTLLAPPEILGQARAQLLTLLSHIKAELLPVYLSSIQPVGPTPNSSSPVLNPASSQPGLIPPPPGAFFIGNLHTGLFSLLKASGEYSHPDPVPGLRIHRFNNPPYVKYLFRGHQFVSPGSASAPLPAGYRFTDKTGRLGVQSHHLDLIRSRTSIPRSRETLNKLPGAPIYSDRETQPHPSDSSGAADNPHDRSAVGEMPIAWAFLGVDGSLATLHVEPEYRGQGLAMAVAQEAMRLGMAEGGIWRDHGEEGEVWVHTNALESNIASRRVMEKLGAEPAWTCTWTVLEWDL
ncbi:hypothetical protein BDV25DRAFT_164932 [Aspergillus avenaceus]|uniref:N-acetyltransferase domain-containing protein n=1 Tax=Aspergillus avenaceus TaxID=36643 RepID=A0A5N6TG09_ASPAV|nr:hypothetical protein BDV25DRAFT_164932 [Aspergillus avenaceus]